MAIRLVALGNSYPLAARFGKFGDTMLPSNISPESVPDKCHEFYVHKIEEIRSSFDPDRSIPTNPLEFSGTVFVEFQLVTENVKTTVLKMSKSLVISNQYLLLSFVIVWMEKIP